MADTIISTFVVVIMYLPGISDEHDLIKIYVNMVLKSTLTLFPFTNTYLRVTCLLLRFHKEQNIGTRLRYRHIVHSPTLAYKLLNT